VLEVRDLAAAFETDAGTLVAVDGVSFDIAHGQRFGLVGESGSGKSVTALSVLGLVDAPGRVTAERVRFEGQDLLGLTRGALRKIRGRRIGYVMQDPLAALSPVYPVGEQIAETIREHERGGRRAAARRAVDLLERVGIPDPAARARDFPHQLSGGMRQRVAIAIALACNPSLLIADEPTTALDVTIQAQVLELLAELSASGGMAVLIITHDLGVIARFADELAVMYAGRIVERGAVEDVFARPAHPYTAALLASQPQLDGPRHDTLPTISGSPPDLVRRPPGCAFEPRCGQARGRSVCREDDPALRALQAHRLAACHFAEELLPDGAATPSAIS
jgi:oligopeptide/dipeptide ABC transporter ATP-binding protein